MRSEKQKLANYTELIHAGEGVTIEKGVISASGGSGGAGGGAVVVEGVYSHDETRGYMVFDGVQVFNALNAGQSVVLFFPFPEDGDCYANVLFWGSTSDASFLTIIDPLSPDPILRSLELYNNTIGYGWLLGTNPEQ